MENPLGRHIQHLKRSFEKHFDGFLANVRAAWRSRLEAGPITDDSARSDGGNTTEHQPVSDEKLTGLAHTAVDHTREESGS